MAIDDVDEHEADHPAEREAHRETQSAHQEPLSGEHGADLSPRHSEVAQHAELAPPREHQRAEARGEPEEADDHSHRLERIGHREGAIEDLERDFADLSGAGDLEVRRARDARLDLARHARRVRARREPQCRVVGVGVARMAQVLVALDQHRALLARVIAPDACDGEARAPPAERDLDDGAGPPPVQIGGDFAHPCRWRLARFERMRGTEQRRHPPFGLDRAGKERERRPVRSDEQALAAQELGATNAGQRCDGLLVGGREKGRVRARPRAHIEIRGQHALQPLVQRLAEGGDHDRHRYHEAHARDDRGEAHSRLSRSAAKLREPDARRYRPEERRDAEAEHRDARHQHHRADQKERDGAIAEQRQPAHRPRLGEGRAREKHRNSRPHRLQPPQRALFIARLQGGRGHRTGRFQRGREAAEHRCEDPERQEQRERRPVEHRRRREAAEISAPELCTEALEHEGGARMAERDSGERPHGADDGGFGEEHRNQLPPRHAQDAKQRELRAPAHHGESLRRKNEQPAGEERHQRQHVEVDAVGARQRAASLDVGVRPLDESARRHLGAQALGQALRVGPRAQPQVDAVQKARALEDHLCRTDVDDRKSLTAGLAQHSGDLQRAHAQAHLDGKRVAFLKPERLGGGCGKKNPVRAQKIQPLAPIPGRQKRLDAGRAKEIEPQDPERLAAPGEPRLHLEHRTRHRHFGQPCDARVQRLVETRPGAANSQIGLSGERLHGGGEFVDGRLVDELDGVAESDAERDGENRESEPALVLRERREQEAAADRVPAHCAMLARGPRAAGSAAARRALVDQDPVHPELGDRAREGGEVDRLAHVAVRAGLVAAQHVLVLARRGEDDHGDEPGARIGAYAVQHVDAVELGKLEIEQDHGGHRRRLAPGVLARSEQEVDRFLAVPRDDDAVGDVGLSQRAQRQLLVVRVVFDEHDRLFHHPSTAPGALS